MIQPHLLIHKPVGKVEQETKISSLVQANDPINHKKRIHVAALDNKYRLFASGLHAACAECYSRMLKFFSVHDIFYNTESETLNKSHQELRFLVRCPQSISKAEQHVNFEKLNTILFYKSLIRSQNYQLFKEEVLQPDIRIHSFTNIFKKHSHNLLELIIQEQTSKFQDSKRKTKHWQANVTTNNQC